MGSITTAQLSISGLYNSYKRWVSNNPQQASDLEMTIKWVSYFLAGRVNNSHVFSELVYCLSNMLVLYNDRIICNYQKVKIVPCSEQIKVWMTVLEYSEVFLELSAFSTWGNRGKWLVIATVQIAKCICRLLLVYHYKEHIIAQPPIPPLDRRIYNNSFGNITSVDSSRTDACFSLKSGRVIRKISASPDIRERKWKVPTMTSLAAPIKDVGGKSQRIAETVYVMKPIVHLGCVSYLGTKKWTPWLVSFALDLYSLHMYRTYKLSLSTDQKFHISRRHVQMLLYLLRSPFYDKYSKRKIELTLLLLSQKLPLAHMICKPILKYLPFWQSTYFYMWSA